MDSFEFSDLTAQNRRRISLIIRAMTMERGKFVLLEEIRANPDLSCYSDAQIYACIRLLVDDGWRDLCCSNLDSYQLKNGYIYRRA